MAPASMLRRSREKAVEKGLITQETADTFTTEQAIDLLFQPGFSTADKITDISGRGVGLDVVKTVHRSAERYDPGRDDPGERQPV